MKKLINSINNLFIKQKEDKLGPIQRKWVNYLKSHPKQQQRKSLGTVSHGIKKYCCLGIGGEIAGVCEWKNLTLYTVNKENPYLTSTATLSKYVYEALGLNSPEGASKNESYKFSLAHLNDNGTTWAQIAEILEKYPEDYFTHKV